MHHYQNSLVYQQKTMLTSGVHTHLGSEAGLHLNAELKLFMFNNISMTTNHALNTIGIVVCMS